MTNTDAPTHVESTTYHGQVHGDKPFNADEWLQKAGAAFDHATLCSKLSGGTFASAHEWWEAREVASTAEQVVVATLVAAHGRLLAAEKLAGAHVDARIGSPVDAVRTLRTLGYAWVDGRWAPPAPPAPTRSVLDQPLGVLVTLGNTTFGPGCPVREVIEYAEQQRCRAARLTEAARWTQAGFPAGAPGTALSLLSEAAKE